ncbi:thioredoxin [Desulfocarbo indianensis]|nr:thioredoxin [Desulfocarbo indianensis]
MPNRLAQEKSPYLLQHAHNPVDWFPWGEEAFAKAKAEEKPVFLSVGYATCHWCHVMAHECFEDQEVAEALNRDFVSIKVDREERPDLDGVYMNVCQALTGAGGWPLSVFLTPEQKPFFAGTYFPKTSRLGRPGFLDLLANISRMWSQDRGRILSTGDRITEAVRPRPDKERAELDMSVLEKAYWQLAGAYDPKWGGFGRAPKFPTPHHLNLLLRWHARQPGGKALEMVEATLKAMRRGGIWDHLGLGFHRYSVDERWLAPHFEKMLYDQALLAHAYLEAHQVTGNELYAQTARDIFAYALRDLTSPEGAFYSAEDADSEGEEGLFYVWTPPQVAEVLEDQDLADFFCAYHDVGQHGNFEHGRSIIWENQSLEPLARHHGLSLEQASQRLAQAREKLFQAREKRPRPLRDDKVLAAWNGLMIAALAKGAAVLGRDEYREAAARAAEFVLAKLRDRQGRLLRRWRQGQAQGPGYLDDHAFMIWGLIELYESGFDPAHLAAALELADAANRFFWDDLHHGYFFTPHHGENLIVREKDLYDGALPSGNSSMALNLLRLARLTGDQAWENRAHKLMAAMSAQVAQQPMAYTQFLMALDFALGPAREVVVAGEPEHPMVQELLGVAKRRFLPNRALLLKPGGAPGRRLAQLAPFTEDMSPGESGAAAYVCRDFACQRPVATPADLIEALK